MHTNRHSLEELRLLVQRSLQLDAGWVDVPQLVVLSSDPDVALGTLENIVTKRSGLAAKVMRVARSAYYGRQEVRTLSQAIANIGLGQLRNIFVVAMLHSDSSERKDIFGFDRDLLNKRCLGIAIATRMKCERLSDRGLADSAYLAGLLQELGYMVWYECAPQMLSKLIAASKQMPGEDLVNLERHLFGYTHADLGAMVGEEWDFSEEIVQSIRHHHEPLGADLEYLPLIDRAHYASWMCYEAGLPPFKGATGHEINELTSKRLADALATGVEVIQPLNEELDCVSRHAEEVHAAVTGGTAETDSAAA